MRFAWVFAPSSNMYEMPEPNRTEQNSVWPIKIQFSIDIVCFPYTQRKKERTYSRSHIHNVSQSKMNFDSFLTLKIILTTKQIHRHRREKQTIEVVRSSSNQAIAIVVYVIWVCVNVFLVGIDIENTLYGRLYHDAP